MKGELERGVDIALAGGSMLALAGLAFVAVVREGLETSSSCSPSGPRAAGRRSDARRRLRRAWRSPSRSATAIFAAGHPDRPAALLHDHRGRAHLRVGRAGAPSPSTSSARPGCSPISDAVVFDLGAVLPESSPLGAAAGRAVRLPLGADVLEVVGYLAYLIPVLTLFVCGRSIARGSRRPAAAGAPPEPPVEG